jgi:hypothetical protein
MATGQEQRIAEARTQRAEILRSQEPAARERRVAFPPEGDRFADQFGKTQLARKERLQAGYMEAAREHHEQSMQLTPRGRRRTGRGADEWPVI